MNQIKLYFLEDTKKGCIRLQSQLTFFRNTNEADYILKDGQLFFWNGNGWTTSNVDYQIIFDKNEMNEQTLFKLTKLNNK